MKSPSVHGENAIAGTQTGALGRRAWFQPSDDGIKEWQDADAAHRTELRVLAVRRKSRGAELTVAEELHAQRSSCVRLNGQAEIHEIPNRLAIDRHDPVADLKACTRRRLVRQDLAQDRLDHCLFGTDHAQGGDEDDGDQQVDERPGEENEEALPLRLGEELAGIAALSLFGRIAGHAHVPAQRDERDAVVGLSLPEAE